MINFPKSQFYLVNFTLGTKKNLVPGLQGITSTDMKQYNIQVVECSTILYSLLTWVNKLFNNCIKEGLKKLWKFPHMVLVKVKPIPHFLELKDTFNTFHIFNNTTANILNFDV